jgi:ketosteroid isomerase-like protein
VAVIGARGDLRAAAEPAHPNRAAAPTAKARARRAGAAWARGVALLALGALGACTVERAEIRRPARSRPVATAEDSANVRGTVLAVASAVRTGDLDELERRVEPGLVVFADGHVHTGWTSVRDGWLRDAFAATRDRQLELGDLQLGIAGPTAFVTFRYRFRAAGPRGGLDAEGLGTAVLQRAAGAWRVVHAHLSRTRAPTGGADSGTRRRAADRTPTRSRKR